MARNIEIKARIDNIEALAAKVSEIADKGPIEIFQDDTFFACPNGRMKLRTFSDNESRTHFLPKAKPSRTERVSILYFPDNFAG